MQWLILLFIVGLSIGPIGHQSQDFAWMPNLLVIFLWTTCWFRNRTDAIYLAITGGLLLDLVGWNWFGLWTVSALLVVLIVSALKERLLDASSALHATLALLIVSLIAPLLISFVTKTFLLKEITLGILGNVTVGLVVYYLLAMRLRMFQRWAGKRIG